MDPMELTRTAGLLGGSFIVGLVSGLVPIVNTEAYLLALAVVAPPGTLIPAVLLTTLGQMAAKLLLYLAGRGSVSLPFVERSQGRLAAVRERLEKRLAGAAAVVFSSATLGFPPFYLVSVAAGSLRWPLARFLLVGGCGRLLRFAAIAAVPGLLGVLR
jgi:membrane protein YqaA with SNARE-associated domain